MEKTHISMGLALVTVVFALISIATPWYTTWTTGLPDDAFFNGNIRQDESWFGYSQSDGDSTVSADWSDCADEDNGCAPYRDFYAFLFTFALFGMLASIVWVVAAVKLNMGDAGAAIPEPLGNKLIGFVVCGLFVFTWFVMLFHPLAVQATACPDDATDDCECDNASCDFVFGLESAFDCDGGTPDEYCDVKAHYSPHVGWWFAGFTAVTAAVSAMFAGATL